MVLEILKDNDKVLAISMSKKPILNSVTKKGSNRKIKKEYKKFVKNYFKS